MIRTRVFVSLVGLCVLMAGCATPPAPSVPPSMNLGPQGGGFDPDYAQQVQQNSQGQVEIFPFDEGEPVYTPSDLTAMPQTPVSIYSADQSVDVYGFDEGDGYAPGPDLAEVGRYIVAEAPPLVVSQDLSEDSFSGDGLIIYFGDGQEKLDAADRKALRAFAAHSKSAGWGQIIVEGHASPTAGGGKQDHHQIANLKVSLERAYNVTKRLIQEGVPAARIVTKGYGDSMPAPAETGMNADAASRRVEVHGLP